MFNLNSNNGDEDIINLRSSGTLGPAVEDAESKRNQSNCHLFLDALLICILINNNWNKTETTEHYWLLLGK